MRRRNRANHKRSAVAVAFFILVPIALYQLRIGEDETERGAVNERPLSGDWICQLDVGIWAIVLKKSGFGRRPAAADLRWTVPIGSGG